MATKTEIKQEAEAKYLRRSVIKGVDAVIDHPITAIAVAALEAMDAVEWTPQQVSGGMRDQIYRSITSVPSNVAEGIGRGSTAQNLNFARVARGSAYEALVQSELIGNRALETAATELAEAVDAYIAKMLGSDCIVNGRK